jgi:protein SCO1/2
MPGRRAGVLVVVVAALAGCGSSDRLTSATEVPGAPVAPEFALHDTEGRSVRLSDFRGRVVLLTFLFTHCPDVCPLTVGKLKAALDDLGPRAGRAHVVAVSVDPRGDTPAAVRAFVRRHRMARRMTYLVGTHAQLAPVWRRYGIAVAGPPEERDVGHGSWVYGIDGSGRRRLLYGQDFTATQIVHDLPRLAAR